MSMGVLFINGFNNVEMHFTNLYCIYRYKMLHNNMFENFKFTPNVLTATNCTIIKYAKISELSN